jgi:hypothetical protein
MLLPGTDIATSRACTDSAVSKASHRGEKLIQEDSELRAFIGFVVLLRTLRFHGERKFGSKEFIEETKVKQGISAKGRRIDEKPDGLCVLRETSVPYSAAFDPEIGALRAENAFFLKHF